MKKNILAKTFDTVFAEKKEHSFKPEINILIFGLLICLVAWLTIENLNLFGHKSNSIFDVWTLSHIATGAVISFFVIGFRKINVKNPIILVLLLSSCWEIVEHYLEIMGPEAVANWFAGEESLMNRLVADQLSLVVGFVIIKARPKLFPLMLVISAGILILHIILGDSMYFFN
ncbi:DUF2585 family protein [Patescibacteria group bacterium]